MSTQDSPETLLETARTRGHEADVGQAGAIAPVQGQGSKIGMAADILALEDIPEDAVELCGGKATNLGRLIRFGARVPPGFCVTGPALDRTIAAAGLDARIAEMAAALDFDDFAGVEAVTQEIRALIEQAPMPGDLEEGITASYRALVSEANRYVAVRSSVSVKNSEISSFPGMMDTYHYVLGAEEVLAKVRECWASLWTSRAAYLRHHKKIAHERGVIAPVVQLMVNAESAGVLFTANPISKSRDDCMIEANWGIGESVVSGRSMTDSFILDKASGAVRQKAISKKNLMVVMDDGEGRGRKEIPVPADKAEAATLNDAQLAELCRVGRLIEEHFDFPADIEWAFQDDRLFILQARKIRDLDA
jgi:pyruvate,water dikinase